MELKKKEDILVLIYTYAGGKARNYNYNEDLFTNLSKIIHFEDSDENYMSIDSSFVQIEKKLLNKEYDISEDITDAIDLFVINNGVKFNSKILKFAITVNEVLVFSLGWTMFAIDTNKRSDEILCEIIEALNFIENSYYSNEPNLESLYNETKNNSGGHF